ncbi:MAG: hypothetical protein IV094_23775 [Vitreoscilla sp.]|nr:hypothetical protein [Vitreoscilla sp.]
MHPSLVSLLSAALFCSAAAAEPVPTDQDKRMLGKCAVLGFAVFKAGSAFSEDWSRMGRSLMFMPAVIDPPLKSDPAFAAGRDEMERLLAGQDVTPGNAEVVRTFDACLRWADAFMKKQGK